MERIKKALDKARQQRQVGNYRSGQAVINNPAAVPSDMTRTIEYTRTLCFEPRQQHLRQHRVISALDAQGDFFNAYNMLRTRVLREMQKKDENVLAITSPGQGEGKSLTAINLAISMARELTGTVLLVDANLHQPRLHEFFGFQPEQGLSDYLSGNAAIPDILVNPGIERFVVFPGRGGLANASEMLASPLMTGLVEELKHRYPSRMVIFDLPPVLKADDVLAFAPYVDASLLVVEEGNTDQEDFKQAVALLQDSTHFLGSVLNKTTE